MARTYWKPLADGSLEFLGAFRDGHAVKNPKDPQAGARVIDLTDLDIPGAHERLQVETRPAPPRLVGLPSAIANRLHARMIVPLPWAQLEGYVK